MHCMKCGREVSDGQIFCDSCLKIMDAYPVKPGTAVQLPKRDPRPEKKHTRQVPPSVIIRTQRKAIRWLCLTVAVLFVAFCLVSGLFLKKLVAEDKADTPLGQNYSTTFAP